jgi:hypothetical protein
MPSIDFRSRPAAGNAVVDPSTFLEEVEAGVHRHGGRAARAIEERSLPPLTLDVDGFPITFEADDERLLVRENRGVHLVVEVDPTSFSDLVQDNASTFGLEMQGRARISAGRSEQFLAWEPILRCILDDRPIYEPGSIEFTAVDGTPLDLRQSFHRDDDPAVMGNFLAEAGYLHVSGLFTGAEMADVSDDLDRAVAEASRDDGGSWWARTKEHGWYPARVLGFNHMSAALRELLADTRFTDLGALTGDEMVQRDPIGSDAAEGLLKKVGVVEGISDVVWHKDCAMGGHSRQCSGLTVGLCVTGAGPTSGELGVAAGSHRANVAPLGIDGVDLPRIPIPTRTGDVTIHCSCTLHMSRPPVTEERRVVYAGFALAPRPGDEAVTRDIHEARRDRQELNERSRNLRLRAGTSTISFDLD